MNEKRIYPSKKSIIKTSIIFSLILLLVMFGIFSSRFSWAYVKDKDITPYIIQDIVVLVAWLVISIASSFVLLKKNYYTLTKSCFIHHKLGKEVSYSFSNILYIDEKYSTRHDTILFYLNTGKSVFIVQDEEKKLLNIFKKEAINVVSREAFHAKFPNIKL